MADVDWEAIRMEYVAGGVSLRKLAAKWGVTHSMIAGRSKREGWTKQRDRCRHKAVTKSIDMVAAQKARSLANVMLGADRLSARITGDIEGAANARDVSDLAKALKYAIDTLHAVYGIQTPAQLHRQHMDEERLALDKRRLALEEQAGELAKNPPAVRFVIEAPEGEEDLDG